MLRTIHKQTNTSNLPIHITHNISTLNKNYQLLKIKQLKNIT